MFKRFKNWLINKFLPAWCRQECLDKIKKLKEQNERQVAEISRLNAYIDGMHDALKRQRITVRGCADEHIKRDV